MNVSVEVTPLLDSAGALEDPDELRRRARRDGYLWLRGVHEPGAVRDLRAFVVAVCERLGWLAPGSDPEQAFANPHVHGVGTDHPQSIALMTAVLPSAPLDRIRRSPRLNAGLHALLGDRIATHQGDVCRAVFPNATERTTLDLGPLAVLPGSHLGGLLEHAGADALRPGITAPPTSGWAASDLGCGDAVAFHQLTLHRALPNLNGGRLRLSVDCRYRAETSDAGPPMAGGA
jgi:Phytanoyl-CoA dioxygenase (PhyH)